MLFKSCVCPAFVSVHCCLVVTCWERADLLALVCDVLLCFCHFPMWYPVDRRVCRCTWFFILSIPDLCHLETGLSPPVKYFYRPFQSGTSFVDHLCYLCLVFVIHLRLFIAGLLSPAGKGLTSWLSFVMFNCVFFSLSHVVSCVRCGT